MTVFLKQYLKLIFIGIAIIDGLFFCAEGHSQSKLELSVITHKSVPVDTILKSELKALYMGDKKLWGLNMPIVPVYLDLENEIGAVLFNELINVPFETFKRHWLKRIFAGSTAAPNTIVSNAKVIEFINQTKGSIGTIETSRLGLLGDNCKIIYIKD